MPEQKIDASKENCVKALEVMGRLQRDTAHTQSVNHEEMNWLEDFLKSACRKLPTAEAIARDRARNRRGSKGKVLIPPSPQEAIS